eukprot:s665_g9.t1
MKPRAMRRLLSWLALQAWSAWGMSCFSEIKFGWCEYSSIDPEAPPSSTLGLAEFTPICCESIFAAMSAPSRETSGLSDGAPSFATVMKRIPSWFASYGAEGNPKLVFHQVLRFSEGSSSEEPPKELLYELEPELLRGVPLHVSLGKCGSYWEIPDNGMLNVNPSLYKLSMPVTQLDHFLSHDWHTSRWLKYLALLVLFNSRPAAIATFVVSVSVGVVCGLLGWRGGIRLAVLADLTFLIIFCFWQRLRRCISRRPVMVFMDKLCIAQHDDRLKEAGILGLAAFLKCSKRLTILWSPCYFARLWCTFEVATFLNQGQAKNIDIIPVGMSLLLILLAVHMKFQAMSIHWSLHIQADVAESSFFDNLLIIFLESLLMLLLILYIGIGLMKEVDELPEQLQTFQVRKTKCFCCTSKHNHPDTGAKLPCDRRAVYKQLRDWYSKDGKTSKKSALDSFDHHVRDGLASSVMRSIGGGWYVTYSLTLIYGALMPSNSLWINEAFLGPGGPGVQQQGEEKLRWVLRCSIRLAHQPVLAVLTLWLYMAMCKAGVILTYGCSRITAALILLVPLLIVEFLFKMPVEFFMRITDDTSLIPVIPFAFSLALSLILWWMTTWSVDTDARTREAARGMRGARDRREVKEKEMAKQLEEYGWDRGVSHKSMDSAEEESDCESQGTLNI